MRREFSRDAKVAIIKRATKPGPGGHPQQYCEKDGCGQLCTGRFEIHHLREDALEIDKSQRLSAEDGVLWCKACHSDHTRKHSVPAIALAKRQEAAHLGATTPKQPMAKKPKPAKTSFKLDQTRALGPTALMRQVGAK